MLPAEEAAALARCHQVAFLDIDTDFSPKEDIELWKSLVRSAKEFGDKKLDRLDPFWRQAASARALDRLLNDHPIFADLTYDEATLRYLRQEAANLLRHRHSSMNGQAEQITDPDYRQTLDMGLSQLATIINDLSYASDDRSATQQHLRAGQRLLLKLEGLTLLGRSADRPRQDDPAVVDARNKVAELTGRVPDALVLDLTDEGLEHPDRWKRFFSTASGGPASYTVALRMITINSRSDKRMMLGHEMIHSTQQFPKPSELSASRRRAELALLEGTTEALTVLLYSGRLPEKTTGYASYVAMTLALTAKLDMDPKQALLELNQVDNDQRLDWLRERIPDLPEDLVDRINAFEPDTSSADLQPMIDAASELLEDELWWQADEQTEELATEPCIE